MKPENQLDPRHDGKRGILRVAGMTCLGLGILFAIVGLASFFSTFSHGGGMPHYFWCLFAGLPLVWLGAVLSGAGFAGAAARYLAGESAPVAKDTLNYMADETKEGVKAVAGAAAEGIVAGLHAAKPLPVLCRQCNQPNEGDAKFCKGCGATLPKAKSCATCHATNDSEAKFCNQCGGTLV